jgi:hypothetical protein
LSAAVLQLSVAFGTLVFHICHADALSEPLREFLNNDEIRFWCAAIQRDAQMLKYYGITIHRARDLHREIPNPALNYPPGLYALANAYIETNLSKNDPKIRVIIRDG